MPFTDLANSFSNVVNTAKNALTSGIDNFMSSIRSINVRPNVFNTNYTRSPTVVPTFQDSGPGADWRVKLSVPRGGIWNSNLFDPLREAGGLVFPYTPTITINHSANYADHPVTHQNYQFLAYQNSRVSDITIVGDFIVEDNAQAQYWLSAVHFLRSVTKMYTGEDPSTAGNPPPLLEFNAYGDYVFKNIPVVVKSFSLTLPKEVDYITTRINQLPSTRVSGASMFDGSISGGSNSFGKNASLLAGVASAVGQTKIAGLLNAANGLSNFLNGNSVSTNIRGGTIGTIAPGSVGDANDSHVPTQSSFSVILTPVYSRTAVKDFSLAKFVKGDYVKNGYL
ncbi:MAG: hypothetical protein EBT86_00705 [Actinobacteria bacterium]|nr:hypothetical protein [Actinomycetota bacterium]